MKRTDLESSRPLQFPEPVGAGLSLLLHLVLLGAAVTTWTSADRADKDSVDESAQFLYPLLRPHPRPVDEHISYLGIGGSAPTVQEQGMSKVDAPVRAQEVPADVPAPAPAPVPVPEEPHAYSEIEVDSAAVRDPNSVGPVYPPPLLEARIEGSTLIRFVVDSTGHVEPSSIVVLESTHPLFTQAVREVLPRMKYQPARMGRRPVAQLVEQRFGFRITPPASVALLAH